MRWGLFIAALAAAGGCATYPRPDADRVGAALQRVMTAEAAQIRADSRAHTLRRQARRSYRQATAALAERDHRRAELLLAQAEADAALAVAIAQLEAMTAQADEVERAVEQTARGGRP